MDKTWVELKKQIADSIVRHETMLKIEMLGEEGQVPYVVLKDIASGEIIKKQPLWKILSPHGYVLKLKEATNDQ
jgi:hypothetical protein